MIDFPKITAAENGPLIVENPPDLRGASENDITGMPKVALCRCRLSKNRPFCDGAHYDAIWSDDSCTTED